MNFKQISDYAKEYKIEIIDLKFCDLIGQWHHVSLSIPQLKEELFEEGIGFDGSSIRGFQKIDESDMLLIPDMGTMSLDPFTKIPTMMFVCNVKDPITMEPYSRDPRYVAQKAELYLKSTGIADDAYVGPEAEFFVFDDIRYGHDANCGYFYIDSKEASWNTGRVEEPNLGYKIRNKGGYSPVQPADSLNEFRSEAVRILEKLNIQTEVHHHEVASGGQCEIDLKYGSLLKMADTLMSFKYVIKNLAKQMGKTATFMPKPIFGDNGSGMHTHQSLWKDSRNIFFQLGSYGDISEIALYYIGGLLKHASSLCAFVAPTTNSYRRLVPGYEAPINLVYSQRNRSACIRIPMYSKNEAAKRIEFRTPDATSNPYLAFAAMLMAGIDGIIKKIHPGEPLDKDIYELGPKEASGIKKLPGTLGEVLNALEEDNDYLLKGDVFTPDLIEMWIEYKRKQEVDAIRLRPHPHEFALYFDS